jgi:hypothetical protein
MMREKTISQISLDCKLWQAGQTKPLAEAAAQGSAEGGKLVNDIAAVVDQCLDKAGLAELRARLAAADYARFMKEGREHESAGVKAEARELYSQAYRYALKDEEAMAAVEALAHVPTKTVSRQAEDLMRQGKAAASMAEAPEAFSVAAQYMDQAVALAPWWAAGHAKLAGALEDAGLWALASRHLKLFLALEPAAPDREEILMRIASLSVRKPGAASEALLRAQRKHEQTAAPAAQVASAGETPAETAPVPAAPAPAGAIRSDVDSPQERLEENSGDFAVVVGIEKYSNDLPDAQFAEHDAAAVKNHLLALGYPERNIKILTGQRATYTGMSSYIEDWLPRNVKEDSRVFFYFSGHGAPDPDSGQAYLVPSDGNPNFLGKSAYPLKKLYSNLNGLKAKQVMVALDSCFSGAGGRSVLAQGARPLVSKVDTAAPSNGKLTIFAAASANEITTTLEDQGHGIFTYYFLKGLGGEAKDDSGVISAQGLYDYLKPKVQDAASRQNRDQTPVLEGAGQDSELVRFK